MQTALADFIRDTRDGNTADAILRKCVHCGFCTATCPTYQLLGDELDGPRGRIYLIKQVLEGHEASARTQLHLDRCLTCRSCETTCPSGVEYGRLLDIGRHVVDARVARPLHARWLRWMLRAVLPHPGRFGALLRIGQSVRPLVPLRWRTQIPEYQAKMPSPVRRHDRLMLVLAGCAQSSIAPSINTAAGDVLNALGIDLVSADNAGCCGAVSLHLSARDEALDYARRNIDVWCSYLDRGAEAIVMTASGCGATVREYGYLLADDPHYAAKAARVASSTKDIAEVIASEGLDGAALPQGQGIRVAFQSPCTLQHGQRIRDLVESILSRHGYTLTPVADAHLCCGSAGTYSLLQPTLSRQLLDNKLSALQADRPDVIATANIGCLVHLKTSARVPVKHWIELLARA